MNMFQSLSSGLVVGISSGLIATFLMLVMRNYWNKILQPWYEERIYKDARIEGIWLGELERSDGSIGKFLFHINRNSHHISGSMVNQESGKVYNIEGEFKNTILTLVYSSTIPYEFDRGCFTFLLTKNGRKLEGQGAYYHSIKHSIWTSSCILTRTDTNNAETNILPDNQDNVNAPSNAS